MFNLTEAAYHLQGYDPSDPISAARNQALREIRLCSFPLEVGDRMTCPCERCQSRVEFFYVSWFR